MTRIIADAHKTLELLNRKEENAEAVATLETACQPLHEALARLTEE
jgi:hypothetical protein